MRTTQADREHVIDLLSHAHAEGRLDYEEFDRRVDRVSGSQTYEDLRSVLVGLPVTAKDLPRPPSQRRMLPWAVSVGVVAVLLAAAAGVAIASSSALPADRASMAPVQPAASADSEASAAPTPEVSPTPFDAAPPSEGVPAAPDPVGPTAEAQTVSGTGNALVTVAWPSGVQPYVEYEVDRSAYDTFTLGDVSGIPFFVYIDTDLTAGVIRGSTLVDSWEGAEELRVKVETSGSWTLTFKDVADAPVLAASGSGSGYQVLRHEGPESILSFQHDEGLYAVLTGYRLIVNGVGPGRDEGLLPDGPVLLEVECAGDWEYRVR